MLDIIVDEYEKYDIRKLWRETVGEPIVVVINGVGGSGKDTFVQLVKDKLKTIENPSPFANDNVSIVENISTVDRVKTAARFLGCNVYEKDDKCREFLSKLKDLASEYYDAPYQDCRKHIYQGMFKVCFVHCREPKEIQRFVDEFGAITVLVRRPDIHVPNNSSDMGVDGYEYDYVIDNDGDYFDLSKKAVKFIQDIGLNEWRAKAVLD